MNKDINFQFKTNALNQDLTPKISLDSKYGVYNSIEEACEKVPIEQRNIGLTIGIKENDIIKEYWWQEGILDDNLIIKKDPFDIENLNETDVYLQQQINQLHNVIFRIVEELPETGETNVRYLIRNEAGQGSNLYDEYIWIDNEQRFELYGAAGNIYITNSFNFDNTDFETSIENNVETVHLAQRNSALKNNIYFTNDTINANNNFNIRTYSNFYLDAYNIYNKIDDVGNFVISNKLLDRIYVDIHNNGIINRLYSSNNITNTVIIKTQNYISIGYEYNFGSGNNADYTNIKIKRNQYLDSLNNTNIRPYIEINSNGSSGRKGIYLYTGDTSFSNAQHNLSNYYGLIFATTDGATPQAIYGHDGILLNSNDGVNFNNSNHFKFTDVQSGNTFIGYKAEFNKEFILNANDIIIETNQGISITSSINIIASDNQFDLTGTNIILKTDDGTLTLGGNDGITLTSNNGDITLNANGNDIVVESDITFQSNIFASSNVYISSNGHLNLQDYNLIKVNGNPDDTVILISSKTPPSGAQECILKYDSTTGAIYKEIPQTSLSAQIAALEQRVAALEGNTSI